MKWLRLEDLAKIHLTCSACYICGEYTISPNRNQVTSFIKRAYHACFGIKLGDQDKPWYASHAPSICVSGPNVRKVV